MNLMDNGTLNVVIGSSITFVGVLLINAMNRLTARIDRIDAHTTSTHETVIELKVKVDAHDKQITNIEKQLIKR